MAGDGDLETMLEHAVQRERRLTVIEENIKTHDKIMKELTGSMKEMINWFRGLTFTILGGIIVAGILTALKWHG